MTKSLTGQVALITGASRGIGRAIAERLARDGAAVVVNYARNEEAATEVVKTIAASGGEAVAVRSELRRASDVRELFAAAIGAFGKLDILVLNAAHAIFGPVTTITDDQLEQLLDVNVKAAFFAFQEAARQMTDGGRIVAISAALTRVGYDNTLAYAGTKGAIEQFSLAAARELGKRAITVNVVSPGATNTELYLGLSSEAAREAARARSPFGRLGEPKDVADVVAFLVSDDARWVSGQNIRVNGGALW